MSSPILSIIIPTLNEERAIEKLIADLWAQQNSPSFEVVVADGGSQDGTMAKVRDIAINAGLALSVVVTEPGRAIQMNAAVEKARGDALLFLHADTVITDTLLLHHAHQDMQLAYESLGHQRVAGHFGLHFIREGSGHELAYYFYECKTRLNRPGCINGDQGIWVSRDFFNALGGFDTSLGYMEDARLSARVFEQGDWQTLSGAVFTSARRFESEGLQARQTLNALLCNFDAIGMYAFFERAHSAYQAQRATQRLLLKPFLKLAHQVAWHKGIKQGAIWWWRTGEYVAKNVWQLAFLQDCKRGFEAQLSVSDVEARTLGNYDRFFKPIVESVIGQFMAMIATFCWFYFKLLVGR